MPGLVLSANKEEAIIAQDYLLICLVFFFSKINPLLIASHMALFWQMERPSPLRAISLLFTNLYSTKTKLYSRRNCIAERILQKEELYKRKNCTAKRTS